MRDGATDGPRRLQRVSRGWRNFLRGYRRSYLTIDFSSARRQVSQLTVKAYYQRGARVTQTAIIKYADVNLVNMTINRLKVLNELKIRSSPTGPLEMSVALVRAMGMISRITILELDCVITNAAVEGLIDKANQLQVLRCSCIEPATRFDWQGNENRGLRILALTWYSPDNNYHPYVSSNFVSVIFQALSEADDLGSHD